MDWEVLVLLAAPLAPKVALAMENPSAPGDAPALRHPHSPWDPGKSQKLQPLWVSLTFQQPPSCLLCMCRCPETILFFAGMPHFGKILVLDPVVPGNGSAVEVPAQVELLEEKGPAVTPCFEAALQCLQASAVFGWVSKMRLVSHCSVEAVSRFCCVDCGIDRTNLRGCLELASFPTRNTGRWICTYINTRVYLWFLHFFLLLS